MTTGIIEICGGWGGQLAGPTRYNKRGMFENKTILNAVVKPFLISIGCDPMGQKKLPGEKHIPKTIAFSDELKKEVFRIIKLQGYEEGLWFYKGVKTCLMWQAWHIAFPQAQWIVVRRRNEDIVYSCLRTGFMRAYNDEKDWLKWVHHYLGIFEKMKMAGLNINEIWPQDIVRGDLSKIQTVIAKLGLKWKHEKVKDFISPALWSERKRQHGSQSNHS
jgi:hypothetical protein